jgi:hypothetical protein
VKKPIFELTLHNSYQSGHDHGEHDQIILLGAAFMRKARKGNKGPQQEWFLKDHITTHLANSSYMYEKKGRNFWTHAQIC